MIICYDINIPYGTCTRVGANTGAVVANSNQIMVLPVGRRLSLIVLGSLQQPSRTSSPSLLTRRTMMMMMMMSSAHSGNSAAAAAATSTIAVAQLTSTSSKWDNLVDVARCAGWAKQQNCSMLFLPECFGFIGSSAAETLEAAEDVPKANAVALTEFLTHTIAHPDGNNDAISKEDVLNSEVSLLDGVRHIAQDSRLWISAGGIHLKSKVQNNKVTNSHLILDDTGEMRAIYHKMHLFDVCIPEHNVDLRESKTTTPGTEAVVCPTTPIGTSEGVGHLSSLKKK